MNGSVGNNISIILNKIRESYNYINGTTQGVQYSAKIITATILYIHIGRDLSPKKSIETTSYQCRWPALQTHRTTIK